MKLVFGLNLFPSKVNLFQGFQEELRLKYNVHSEKQFELPYYRKLTLHEINANFKKLFALIYVSVNFCAVNKVGW